jgi:hypothetical protein
MATENPPPASFTRPTYFLVHSGVEDDRSLAERIAHDISDVVDAKCVTVDELDRRFPIKILIRGNTFLILSATMTNDAARRMALARLVAPFYAHRASRFFLHYCVCSGTTPAALREYPELAPIFENVMVVPADDQHLPAVLGELRSFVTSTLPTLRLTEMMWHDLTGIMDGFGGTLALFVHRWFSLAGLVGAAAGIGLLLSWWFGRAASWREPMLVVASFCAGYALNFLQATDLWPWLGRRWKLPRDEDSRVGNLGPNDLARGPLFLTALLVGSLALRESKQLVFAGWLSAGFVGQVVLDRHCRAPYRKRRGFADTAHQALAALGPAGSPRSRCDPADLSAARFALSTTVYMAAFYTVLGLAVRLGPAVFVALQAEISLPGYVVGPAVVGLVAPTVIAFAALRLLRRVAESFGLSRWHVATHGGPMRALPISFPGSPLDQRDVEALVLAPAEAEKQRERDQVLRWLYLLRIRAGRDPLRPWRAAADYAFISYVWRDDATCGVASELSTALSAAGVAHFLDRTNVVSKAGVFRSPVATGLSRCTHFFLVMTPNIIKGGVILTEIESAMQRWPWEMLPAIICVVEDDLAERLRADPEVPLMFRFLLTFCPQMNLAEARNSALVRYVVELTRREGKLHDWFAVLSPATAGARNLRLPGIA